jgi:hypothetical protein
VPEARLRALVDRVLHLDEVDDVRAVTALLDQAD